MDEVYPEAGNQAENLSEQLDFLVINNYCHEVVHRNVLNDLNVLFVMSFMMYILL